MTNSERDTIFAILLVLGPMTACAFLGAGLLFISIGIFILVAGMILQNILGGKLPLSVKRQWHIIVGMFSISIIIDLCRIMKLH